MARYALLVVALVAPGLIAYASVALGPEPATVEGTAPFLFMFLALVVSVFWIARKREYANSADLGFRNSSPFSVVKAVPLAVFFILLFGPLAYWFMNWLGAGNFQPTIDRFRELPVWYMAATILIVAGGEEWLYRGYAIERLEALTGSTWIAGTVSLVAFAIVHLPVWGTGPAITFVISGAILTVLYIMMRDVLTLIIAHVATDLYGLLIAAPAA